MRTLERGTLNRQESNTHQSSGIGQSGSYRTIVHGVPLADRQGNWVQRFRTTDDGQLFVTAQFGRYQEVEQFIKENFEQGVALDEGGDS